MRALRRVLSTQVPGAGARVEFLRGSSGALHRRGLHGLRDLLLLLPGTGRYYGGSPLVSRPDVLVAMTEFSLRKFAHEVASGGLILYNGTSLPADFAAPGVQVVAIPAEAIADKLGSTKAANIVMLGALLEETECLASRPALSVLEDKVKKLDLLEIDRNALTAGRLFIDDMAHVGAVSQPDGFA